VKQGQEISRAIDVPARFPELNQSLRSTDAITTAKYAVGAEILPFSDMKRSNSE
jgi:hypothetical protein